MRNFHSGVVRLLASFGACRSNEKAGSKLWIELIDSLQGLDQITQIQKVNSYFNALTYQSDSKIMIWKIIGRPPISF